jgi:hypothetical protein
MSATIHIHGISATIKDARWTCMDSAILESLENLRLSSHLGDGVNARETIAVLSGLFISEDPEQGDDSEESGAMAIH